MELPGISSGDAGSSFWDGKNSTTSSSHEDLRYIPIIGLYESSRQSMSRH
jgi:hypothetical protein